MRSGRRWLVALAVVAGVVWAAPTPAWADLPTPVFVPPLPPPLRVVAAFSPPPRPWLAGNRGVDLAASAGEPVFAAAAGVVLYAGELAGRGVISIDHGSVRSTYEPVLPAIGVGATVIAGQLIGRVSTQKDSCGRAGSCLHWGAITADGYVDPLRLLKRARVRLLPLWQAGPTGPQAELAASAAGLMPHEPTAVRSPAAPAAAAGSRGPPPIASGGPITTTHRAVSPATKVVGVATIGGVAVALGRVRVPTLRGGRGTGCSTSSRISSPTRRAGPTPSSSCSPCSTSLFRSCRARPP